MIKSAVEEFNKMYPRLFGLYACCLLIGVYYLLYSIIMNKFGLRTLIVILCISIVSYLVGEFIIRVKTAFRYSMVDYEQCKQNNYIDTLFIICSKALIKRNCVDYVLIVMSLPLRLFYSVVKYFVQVIDGIPDDIDSKLFNKYYLPNNMSNTKIEKLIYSVVFSNKLLIKRENLYTLMRNGELSKDTLSEVIYEDKH